MIEEPKVPVKNASPTVEEEDIPQGQVVVTSVDDPVEKRGGKGTTPVVQPKSSGTPGKPSLAKKLWLILLVVDVIIVLGLVVMAISYQKMRQERALPGPTPVPTETGEPAADESTSDLETQGTSDEIDDIESDLNATEFSDLDKELEDIESELATP